MSRVFLAAEWRYLAMLSFRVPRDLLAPLVPRGTELDLWQGDAYMSIVGFLFKDTRVFGVPVPFHDAFEEVNLRFYVRREVNGELRRGVTFIRELVPRHAVAQVARLTYNEPYQTVPMRHRFGLTGPAWRPISVEYAWRARRKWSRLRITPTGVASRAKPDTEEAFVTEHYWGYTRSRFGTLEYEIRHPSWTMWHASSATLEGNLSAVYGDAFAHVLAGNPASALLAEGSAVAVLPPARLSMGHWQHAAV